MEFRRCPEGGGWTSCWRGRTEGFASRFAIRAQVSHWTSGHRFSTRFSPPRRAVRDSAFRLRKSSSGPRGETSGYERTTRVPVPYSSSNCRQGATTMTERILIVDDDASFRRVVEFTLQEEGYETAALGDAEEALQAFLEAEFSLVVTDMLMPRLTGLDLLTRMHAVAPEVPVVVVTAHAELENAVQAMREGAFDYLQKPVNRDELKIVVRRALDVAKLKNENRELRQVVSERLCFENMIGVSKAIQKIFATAAQAARFDSTVLILGESGTGKELLAKAIHFNGPRKDRPFVVVNCGAIPATLLESELFGHTRGAFTGALADRKGKIEAGPP